MSIVTTLILSYSRIVRIVSLSYSRFSVAAAATACLCCLLLPRSQADLPSRCYCRTPLCFVRSMSDSSARPTLPPVTLSTTTSPFPPPPPSPPSCSPASDPQPIHKDSVHVPVSQQSTASSSITLTRTRRQRFAPFTSLLPLRIPAHPLDLSAIPQIPWHLIPRLSHPTLSYPCVVSNNLSQRDCSNVPRSSSSPSSSPPPSSIQSNADLDAETPSPSKNRLSSFFQRRNSRDSQYRTTKLIQP